jgi:hypothetical protein
MSLKFYIQSIQLILNNMDLHTGVLTMCLMARTFAYLWSFLYIICRICQICVPNLENANSRMLQLIGAIFIIAYPVFTIILLITQ